MYKKFLGFIMISAILINSFFCNNLIFFAESIDISAPCAVLIEPSSKKILFEKNSNDARSAASVMKIMELLCAMEEISKGKTNENSKVVISDTAASAKGANIWLKENEILTVGELLKAIAMVSANDASVALREHIFGTAENCISHMNSRAKELGLKNTKFESLEITDENSGTTTAADLAIITSELIKHKKIFDFSSHWIDSVRNGNTQIVNTNRLVKTYPGTIGIKTGTDKNSGSCISAVAEKNGITMVAIVLGAENVKERDKSTITLLDYGFSNFKKFSSKLPENFPKSAKILNGMQNEIKLNVKINSEIFLPNSSNTEIIPEIQLNEEITAPVKKGDIVGKIIYKSGTEQIASYDITSAENVDEIGFKPMFMIFLKNFLAI